MEENQITDDSNLEEAPAERSLEEQLEVTKLTMIKERNRGKQLEKENRELKKQQEAQQKQLAQLQQQFEMFSLGGDKPVTPDVVIPQEKRSESPDLAYQQAAKQVVSGLQRENEELKAAAANERKERKNAELKKAIFTEFVKAGGILPSDPQVLNMQNSDDSPYENVELKIMSCVREENDEIFFVDKNGNIETDSQGVPLTLAGKMQRIQQSLSYSSCFKSDNNNIGMGTPTGTKNNYTKGASVRSAKDMATGKVKLEDILNGKAVIRD